MGVTISYLPGMMEHVTGRVPTGEILGLDSPDRFHVKYSAGGLVVLAQIADWKENEEPDLAKSQVKHIIQMTKTR